MMIINHDIAWNIGVIIMLGYMVWMSYYTEKTAERYWKEIKLDGKTEMKQFLIAEVFIMIYLCYFIVAINPHIEGVWTPIAVTFSMGVILFILYVTLYLVYAKYINEDNDKRIESSKEQIARQIAEYEKFEEYNRKLQEFRIDYQRLMSQVSNALEKKDYQGTSDLLASIDERMRNNVGEHKIYSNSALVNTVLIDCANRCLKEHIRFDGKVTIPLEAISDELKVVEIGTNLVDNAIEACLKVRNESQRFIAISSSLNDGWFTVMISNSFAQRINIDENGTPLTSKKDKLAHGIGLKEIERYVDNVNGIIDYDINEAEYVFTVSISVFIAELAGDNHA